MLKLPLNVGVLHFVGIGGIGMSGIAEILHTLGYKVQGSDVALSKNVLRLQDLGLKVFIGHDSINVEDADYLVISSAINKDNIEYQEAIKRNIPIVRRSEMLAEVMRLCNAISVAGTHGKTTTTSLIATILNDADMDPTIINGGVLNSLQSNARLGKGPWLVAEADESDGTFLKLPSTVAVVTNIDPEHLENYGDSFDELKKSFEKFISNIPFYGFAVLCMDHPEVRAVKAHIVDRRIVTYGFNKYAMYQIVNSQYHIGSVSFDIQYNAHDYSEVLGNITLPLPGDHNMLNATAAVVTALEIGIKFDIIKDSLAKFKGVGRRFTVVGQSNGVTVVDDYAHHPVEIQKTLNAAKQTAKATSKENKVIAILQPHRYSRLKNLFDDFCTSFDDADHVFILDVYSAGEEEIVNFTSENLAESLILAGHKSVKYIKDEASLASQIAMIADDGDIITCLGAGSITNIAKDLPSKLDIEYSNA